MDRRDFLRSAALLGLGAAAACSGASTATTTPTPSSRPASSPDVEILASAVAREHRAAFAYGAAVASVAPDDPSSSVLSRFRDHHEAHAGALSRALELAGHVPPSRRDEYDLVGTAPLDLASLENGLARDYLEACGKAVAGELAQSLANIMAIEARHAAVLRAVAGQASVPEPFLADQ